MRQITRRTMLAGSTAAAATALAPTSGIRRAAADVPCMAMSVKEFLASARALPLDDCQDIVDQADKLLRSFYAHLPLKRAMYGVDPLERLRLARQRLGQLGGGPSFHAE